MSHRLGWCRLSAMNSRHSLDVPPGTVFGFRTRPAFIDSPAETGRYGAFAVIARPAGLAVIVAFDGVWPRLPTLDDVHARSALRRSRFGFSGQPAVFAGNSSWTVELDELTELGIVDVDGDLARLAAPYADGLGSGTSFSAPGSVDRDVEVEWRWHHDRTTLLAEHAADQARAKAAAGAAELRYRARLKDLTFAMVLREDPFERWTTSPPFPPAEFRRAATSRVHQTCRELAEMGPRPRKALVRKALTALVEWFNRADEAAGGVIETEEREDVFRVIEEIAFVARHKAVVEEVAKVARW